MQGRNKKNHKNNNNKKITGSHECSPNGLLSINVRTCNPSPLVHQDMTKKTTFYEKNIWGKIIQVKCKIGLWFLSSEHSLINIYVCTKFDFNPLCTFQDMARTGIHNDKWLRGNNSINIQGRIMVFGHCPSPSLPSIWNQVSVKCQQ